MKVTTKGYYKVINKNGEQISKHTVFQKALESAINSKSSIVLFPDKIEIVHDTIIEEDTSSPDTLIITHIK